jgi:hypothetical protein
MKITDFLSDNPQVLDLTVEDFAFISKVLSFISNGMKLPLNLDSADVITAIQNNHVKYYKICPWATVDDLIVFDMTKLNRPIKEFFPQDNPADTSMRIANDTIILPPKVEEVFEVKWLNRGIGAIGAFDYVSWKMEAMLAGGTLNAFSSQQGADTYMASVYVANTIRSMAVETVQYNYNDLTHELKIFDDRRRQGQLHMEVARRIPLTALYQDDWFYRWISALVIIAKVEHMTLFDAKLPGDLNLNLGDVKSRGEKLYEEVVTYLEQETEHNFNFIKDTP